MSEGKIIKINFFNNFDLRHFQVCQVARRLTISKDGHKKQRDVVKEQLKHLRIDPISIRKFKTNSGHILRVHDHLVQLQHLPHIETMQPFDLNSHSQRLSIHLSIIVYHFRALQRDIDDENKKFDCKK